MRRPSPTLGSTPHPERPGRPFWPVPAAAILLTLAFVAVSASFQMGNERQQTRQRAAQQLSQISDLKTWQILGWYRERCADAEVFTRTPALVQQAASIVQPDPPPDAIRDFARWMQTIRNQYHTTRITLFDGQGLPLLSDPPDLPRPIPHDSPWLQKVLHSRQWLTRDLADPPTGIRPEFWIPVGIPDQPGQPARGTLVIEIDPADVLFPEIEAWSLADSHGETFLLRNDGTHIFGLRQVNGRGVNSPIPPLSPGDKSRSTLIEAAKGRDGLLEGSTPDGKPVLAYARHIPTTPWSLVAQVELESLLRSQRDHTFTTTLTFGSLAFALILAMAGWWHLHDVRELKRRLASEQATASLAKRYELLHHNANDIILLLDNNYHIVEANQRAVESYGYPRKDLVGRHVRDLRAPSTRNSLERDQHSVNESRRLRFETIHIRSDGSEFPVDVSSQSLQIDGHTYIQSIVRDISERRAQEAEIQRFSRLYAILSKVNHAATHCTREEDFLQQVCDAAVSAGGFSMAAIGIPDPETHTIINRYNAGDRHGYFARIRIRSDEAAEGLGPTGTAMREDRTYVCNDFLHDPRTRPWHDAAARSGVASSIALPLRDGNIIFGAITVYAAEPGFFRSEEIRLLEEIAAEISHARASLRQADAQARLAAIVASSDDAILSVAPDGSITTWNQSATRIFGYPADETHRRHPEFLFPAESRDAIRNSLRSTITNGASPHITTTCLNKHGARIPVALSMSPVRDPAGTICGAAIVLRDITNYQQAQQALRRANETLEQRVMERTAALHAEITERERIQESLRRQEETYRVIVENSTQVIYDLDPTTGRVMRAGAIEQVIGYSPEEFQSLGFQSWLDAIHPEDRSRLLPVVDHLPPGRFTLEYRFRRKDGSYAHILDKGIAIPGEHGSIVRVLGCMHDITEAKHHEVELRLAKEGAEVANQAKSAFLANMSHEIRTPMNAILGHAQLLLRDPDASPRQRHQLSIIQHSGKFLLSLINDILEMSRIEAGGTTLHPVLFSPTALLHDMAATFQPQTDAKHLAFEILTAYSVPHNAVGDETKLRQILFNLLGNAVKFTHQGHITLRSNARPSDNGRIHLTLEVEDSGVGIAADEQPLLFERFTQTHSGKTSGSGSGLGLSIIREFVRLMDGSIHIDSQPGRGSTFRVTITLDPADPDRSGDLPTSDTGTLQLAPDAPPCRVLIVDDREENRELLRLMLEPAGFEIRMARSAEDAITEFQNHRPHAILMDLKLPGADGCQATRAICAFTRGRFPAATRR